ncbi:MAG: 7TM diverse intracellular signaling domain-containing protein [Chitinophagales bacterium]
MDIHITKIPSYLWVLLLLFTSNLATVNAQIPMVELDHNFQTAPINEYIYHIEDEFQQLSIDDLLQESIQDAFIKGEPQAANSGINDHTHWYRLKLKNLSAKPTNLMLEIDWALMYQVVCYEVSDSNKVDIHYAIGRIEQHDRWEITFRNPVLKLKLDAKESRTYFIKVTSKHFHIAPINLYTAKAFDGYKDNTYLLIGLFYGMIFVMVFYHLFLYFSIGDIAYLYYTFYIVSFFLFQAGFDGVAFQYIYPSSTFWINYAVDVYILSTLLFFLLFVRTYLQVKTYYSHLNTLFNGMILSTLVLGVLTLTLDYQVRFYFQELMFLLTAALMLYTGSHYFRNKHLPVRFYFFATLPLFLGVVLLLLMLNDFVSYSFFTQHCYQIGFGIELLLTSLNLGERFNIVKAEKETAEEKQKISEKIVHITSSFSANVELRTACQVLSENIATFIQFDALFVFLKQTDNVGYHMPYQLNDGKLVNTALLQQIQNLVINNEYESFEEIKDINSNIKQTIIFPLTFKEKTGGYVVCFNKQGDAVPSQTALEICANVVAQSSVALQRADLWTQLKESREKFEGLKEELDQFTYMVSHDLREPLRTISSFIKVLEKHYGRKMDEAGNELLHYVTNGATRMQLMIDSLLKYARLSKEVTLKQMPVKQAIDQAVANLSRRIHEHNATVNIEVSHEVFGSEQQLVQLFQNLISNAIKYQRENIPPVINITEKITGDQVIIEVADNGVGIAPENYDRIFEIFSRLGDRYSTDSAGIGLSICKKIMDNHEGKITLESTMSEGSHFFLSFKNGAITISKEF